MLIKIEHDNTPFKTWINSEKIMSVSTQSRFNDNSFGVFIIMANGVDYNIPFPSLEEAEKWVDKLLICVNGRL